MFRKVLFAPTASVQHGGKIVFVSVANNAKVRVTGVDVVFQPQGNAMSELKLILGEEASASETAKVNPMDALNRRDIELIKRSLASMHKDCAELRTTIVALHARQSSAPSRGFFLGCGLTAFAIILGLSIARPHLDGAFSGSTAVAKSTSSTATP